jgi:ABC-2 type transport system permease protein
MTQFDIRGVLMVLGVTILSITLAFVVFYRGLRRYSSSNLMISKI